MPPTAPLESKLSDDHFRVLQDLLAAGSAGASGPRIAASVGLETPRVYQIASDLLGLKYVSRPAGTIFYLTPAGQTIVESKRPSGDPST